MNTQGSISFQSLTPDSAAGIADALNGLHVDAGTVKMGGDIIEVTDIVVGFDVNWLIADGETLVFANADSDLPRGLQGRAVAISTTSGFISIGNKATQYEGLRITNLNAGMNATAAAIFENDNGDVGVIELFSEAEGKDFVFTSPLNMALVLGGNQLGTLIPDGSFQWAGTFQSSDGAGFSLGNGTVDQKGGVTGVPGGTFIQGAPASGVPDGTGIIFFGIAGDTNYYGNFDDVTKELQLVGDITFTNNGNINFTYGGGTLGTLKNLASGSSFMFQGVQAGAAVLDGANYWSVFIDGVARKVALIV